MKEEKINTMKLSDAFLKTVKELAEEMLNANNTEQEVKVPDTQIKLTLIKSEGIKKENKTKIVKEITIKKENKNEVFYLTR